MKSPQTIKNYILQCFLYVLTLTSCPYNNNNDGTLHMIGEHLKIPILTKHALIMLYNIYLYIYKKVI